MDKIIIKNKMFSIQMEVTEIEERLPSFKMAVNVTLNHPTGIFSYTADDIWFECVVWEQFLREVKTINESSSKATLNDMSEWFKISITSKENNHELSLTFREQFMDVITTLAFSHTIEKDVLHQLQSAFGDFSTWC